MTRMHDPEISRACDHMRLLIFCKRFKFVRSFCSAKPATISKSLFQASANTPIQPIQPTKIAIQGSFSMIQHNLVTRALPRVNK